MVFKLVRTDTVDAYKIELPVGEHIFGRGKFLDCEDKRISRNHGQLQVTKDTVELKALHQNPCFYIKQGSEEVIMLTTNNATKLSHGDKFGLLPTSYWYEMLHCILPNTDGNKTNSNSNGIDIPETQEMIQCDNSVVNNINRGRAESPTFSQNEEKTEFNGNDSELLDVNLNESVGNIERSESPSLLTTDNQPQAEDPPQISDLSQTQLCPVPFKMSPKTSPSKRSTVDTEQVDMKRVKTESMDDADNDTGASNLSVAGPSNPQAVKVEPPTTPVKPDNNAAVAPVAGPVQRERCIYGARCYRKNPQHKAQFSHPSDHDWGTDDLGQCPYGAACVKRDPRHWQTHTHPAGTQQPSQGYVPGMRVVKKHGNTFYINAHTVNFYDDHFQAEDSDGDSVDFDYEF